MRSMTLLPVSSARSVRSLFVANECRSELETHCAGVEVGDGRVAQCLKDHAAELSPGCDQALTDVGVQ